MTNDELIFGDTISTNIFGDKVEAIEKTPDDKDLKPSDKSADDLLDDKPEKQLESSTATDAISSLLEGLQEPESNEPIDKPADSNTDSVYTDAALTLIELGEWEDIEIEEGAVLDKSDFAEIQKEQKKIRLEKLRNEVFGQIEPAAKEYLDFIKDGGDFKSFIKAQSIQDNVEELDISTAENQKSVILAYHRHILNDDDEFITKHIARLEASMDLEDAAIRAKAKLEAVTAKQKNDLIAAQKAQIENRRKLEENYKIEIKNTLKEEKLEVKQINQILKDFTERDEETKLTEIDKRFIAFRNDPSKIKTLWEFLTNPEEFLKKSVQQVKNEQNLDTFKKFKFVKSTKKSISADDEDSNFIDIGLQK